MRFVRQAAVSTVEEKVAEPPTEQSINEVSAKTGAPQKKEITDPASAF